MKSYEEINWKEMKWKEEGEREEEKKNIGGIKRAEMNQRRDNCGTESLPHMKNSTQKMEKFRTRNIPG